MNAVQVVPALLDMVTVAGLLAQLITTAQQQGGEVDEAELERLLAAHRAALSRLDGALERKRARDS